MRSLVLLALFTVLTVFFVFLAARGISSEIPLACLLNTYAIEFCFPLCPPTTGQIRTNGPIDYEMQPGYELVVACNDNGTPPMQNITFVFVQITDLNDNPPIFAPPKDSAGISQLAPAGTLIYVARVCWVF